MQKEKFLSKPFQAMENLNIPSSIKNFKEHELLSNSSLERRKRIMTRLISIVSKPIKIVVVVVVFVVVLFFKKISSKKCLVQKNLGQKILDSNNIWTQYCMQYCIQLQVQYWVQYLVHYRAQYWTQYWGSIFGKVLCSIFGFNIGINIGAQY